MRIRNLRLSISQAVVQAPGVHPGFQFCTAVLLALSLLSGCGKKAEVKSQITELEKAFPAATSAAPAPESVAGPAPLAEANVYVKTALSAVQANDYAGSVIALQTAQSARGITEQQFKALQQAKQAITTDLINRADRGDAKAQADLARIEKTRSQ